jgi:hypothetical protein
MANPFERLWQSVNELLIVHSDLVCAAVGPINCRDICILAATSTLLKELGPRAAVKSLYSTTSLSDRVCGGVGGEE